MSLTNQEMVKCLTAAKKYLDDERRVCSACFAAETRNEITINQNVECRSVIMNRIRPYATVSEWLYMEKNIPVNHGYDADMCNTELLAYRHRWIDDMIREFSVCQ